MTLQGAKHRKPVVVGNYRFTGRLLGKGNFARVEEAVHNFVNIKVAIKVMDINQIKEEYVIRNLCREAKLMSKLNHPCIAALYETMQGSDNIYYLVTELVSGGDLCSFIKGQRTGRLEERPTRMYARQFVSALAHMHTLGVVHRDLKMENVMLNSIQTQIKIVDFGLSNLWSPGSLLRTHCGSPEYAAPELFVTGKQYGPEVDLWSLGIILYGMVVGQLPFVSNHSDHVSSQERRKKLVAQINRGLNSQHRRILATFSPEFRNMMNKLLIADTSKRIKIKELLVHPWITEKGRKLIRTNPIRELDSTWQAKIITNIATLVDANESVKVITSVIHEEPYGQLGGIYNLMAHKHCLSQISGDGVTRTLPSLDLNNMVLPSYSRQHLMTTRSSSRKVELNQGDNIYVTKAHLNKLYQRLENNTANWNHDFSKIRPATVHPEAKPSPHLDYRDIKSPALRRKAYSASITPKTIRASSQSAESDQKRSNIPVMKKGNKDGSKKPNSDKINAITGRGLADALNSIKKLPLIGRTTVKSSKENQTRAQTSIDRKSRSKSEHHTGNRPSTTNPKSPKHGSGVVSSQSDSKTAAKTALDIKNMLKQKLLKSPQCFEKSLNAHGDTPRKSQNGVVQKAKKPVIYDPIARSIAGYVVNNVPQKIHNLPWFKNRNS